MTRWIHRFFLNKATKQRHDESRAIWEIRINGISLRIIDSWESRVPGLVFKELNRNEIGIETLGPISGNIIDIGAQVGMVSIYLAKKFPDAQISSFEAYDANYNNFLENLELNSVRNIIPSNIAVTGDGRKFQMLRSLPANTGGATGWTTSLESSQDNYEVESTTLDNILEDLGSCQLLKIDCEGAEHEILTRSQSLDRIENLVGEFHINDLLQRNGYSLEALENLARQKVRGLVKVKKLKMCE